MLGHRGCRLGITYPEIYEMQARAIFEAALAVAADGGEAPIPEVMVPLVATRRELEIIRELIDRTAKAVFAEQGSTLDYLVGTMIELPRAALTAGRDRRGGRILQLRHQRPDPDRARASAATMPGAFLHRLCREGHLRARSVRHASTSKGVGELIAIAAERGRAVKPELKLGICGEHGGDPASHRLLRGDRPRLCQRLALPRADRPAGGGAGGAAAPAGPLEASRRRGTARPLSAEAGPRCSERRIRPRAVRSAAAGATSSLAAAWRSESDLARPSRRELAHSPPPAPRGGAPRRDSGPSISAPADAGPCRATSPSTKTSRRISHWSVVKEGTSACPPMMTFDGSTGAGGAIVPPDRRT